MENNFIPTVHEALQTCGKHLPDAIRSIAFLSRSEDVPPKVRLDASAKLVWCFSQLRDSDAHKATLDQIINEITTSRATIQQLEHELEIERDKRSKLEQRRR